MTKPQPKVVAANAIALGLLIAVIVMVASLFLPQPFKALGVGLAAGISVWMATVSQRRGRVLSDHKKTK